MNGYPTPPGCRVLRPQDPQHVAQELEVYLVRTDSDGVYDAVARLGTSNTQLKLTAPELSREQLKQMLQRVAREVAQA